MYVLGLVILCCCMDISSGAVDPQTDHRYYKKWLSTRRQMSEVYSRTAPAVNLPSLTEKYSFAPRRYSCCKVGEKVGLKGMSCDVNMYSKKRKNNKTYPQKPNFYKLHVQGKRLGRKLARQVEKCTFLYKKNFKKCCDYRAKFLLQLKNCKYLKSGQARKDCRRNIRLQYP